MVGEVFGPQNQTVNHSPRANHDIRFHTVDGSEIRDQLTSWGWYS